MRILFILASFFSTAALAAGPFIWNGPRAKNLASGGESEPAGTAGLPAYAYINDLTTGIYMPATHQLGLSTNGAERIRLDSSGNVGIGTTTPGARLETTDYFRTIGPVTSPPTSGSGVEITYEPGGGAGYISSYNRSTSTYKTLNIDGSLINLNSGSNGTVVIGNKVGIGVASPTANLDIAGDSSGTTALQLRSGNSFAGDFSSQINFGFNNTDQYRHNIRTRHDSLLANDNAFDFFLWRQGVDSPTTNGTQAVMSLTGGDGTSGYLGLGTSNPSAMLDMGGTSGAKFLLLGTGGSPSFEAGMGINLGQASNSMGFFIGNHDTFSVDAATAFEAYPYPTGYTTRFVVDGQTGNVGMGVAAPSTKLDLASKFQVDGNGNPVKINNVTTSFPASQGANHATLHNDGSGNLTWALSTLTTDVAGTLPIGNGGTGATTKAAAFDALSPMTTAGDTVYGGTSGTGTRLSPGSSTQVLHSGTTPSWSAVSLTGDVTGTLGLGNGGTGQTSASSAFGALSPLTTKGDVLTFSTVNARLGVGSNGQVLSADSTQTTGLKWISPLTNPMTTTADMIVSSDNSGTAARLPKGTANQVLGMNSGATAQEYKTITTGTAGSDFAVANSANTVTLNLPDASASNRGAVTTGTQTLAGVKTFQDGVVFPTAWAGTYTPTISNQVNCEAGAPGTFTLRYQRIGNVVFVFGGLTVDIISAAGTTSFDMTLPIASTLANTYDVGGGMFGSSSVSVTNSWSIIMQSSSTVRVQTGSSTGAGSVPWSFMFMYQIL